MNPESSTLVAPNPKRLEFRVARLVEIEELSGWLGVDSLVLSRGTLSKEWVPLRVPLRVTIRVIL